MLQFRLYILSVVLIVTALAYFYFTRIGSLPESVTQKVPFLENSSEGGVVLSDSLAAIKIPSLPDTTSSQLGIVKDRTEKVSETVGQVLGEAVKEASSSSSLQERAFDYGRYLYCQQVVKDYEARTAQ